jgi:hypothetical protein
MTERLEEFTLDGKNFIYHDFSGFQTLEEYAQLIEAAKSQIVKYPKNSLLTITNMKDIRFDSSAKEIVTEWLTFNKPYVKYGAIIGADGVKKIMLNSILIICGRNNMNLVFTKGQAIDWLLKQK